MAPIIERLKKIIYITGPFLVLFVYLPTKIFPGVFGNSLTKLAYAKEIINKKNWLNGIKHEFYYRWELYDKYIS